MLMVPSGALAADEDPICADRPGKATATCTVLPGRAQVEIGIFDWSRDRTAGTRTDELAIAGTALSFGLTERFHVQLDLPAYIDMRERDGPLSERARGFGDVGVRAKYRLTGDASAVQVALLPFVSFPTAKRSLGSGKVEGGIGLPIDWDLRGTPLSMTMTPEIDARADSDGSGHHFATAQVIGLGAEVSDRLSVSVELWGVWDFDPAGTSRQYTLGGSGAYLLTNDIQLDAGVDAGLNRAAPDLEIYSGISFRF